MGRSEISSMLFRPIMRWPFQSIEEYREETLTIGSPMVFQTAPPQPASKARITWSAQLAGGPEASQKGLGQRIPAKTVERSATTLLQPPRHGKRRAFAISDGVHHFAPAIDAIPARVIA